jgi:hypothetical protein
MPPKESKLSSAGNKTGYAKPQSQKKSSVSQTKDEYIFSSSSETVYCVNTDWVRFADSPSDWDTPGKYDRLLKGTEVTIVDPGTNEKSNNVSPQMKWVKVKIRSFGFEDMRMRNEAWLMQKYLSVSAQQPTSEKENRNASKVGMTMPNLVQQPDATAVVMNNPPMSESGIEGEEKTDFLELTLERAHQATIVSEGMYYPLEEKYFLGTNGKFYIKGGRPGGFNGNGSVSRTSTVAEGGEALEHTGLLFSGIIIVKDLVAWNKVLRTGGNPVAGEEFGTLYIDANGIALGLLDPVVGLVWVLGSLAMGSDEYKWHMFVNAKSRIQQLAIDSGYKMGYDIHGDVFFYDSYEAAEFYSRPEVKRWQKIYDEYCPYSKGQGIDNTATIGPG